MNEMLTLFAKTNEKLKKSIISQGGWLFYIDENMNVFIRTKYDNCFQGKEKDGYHNHWYYDDFFKRFPEPPFECYAILLETDVEFEDANEVSEKYLQFLH